MTVVGQGLQRIIMVVMGWLGKERSIYVFKLVYGKISRMVK